MSLVEMVESTCVLLLRDVVFFKTGKDNICSFVSGSKSKTFFPFETMKVWGSLIVV